MPSGSTDRGVTGRGQCIANWKGYGMRALTMSSMAVVLLLGVATEVTAQERSDRENRRADASVER